MPHARARTRRLRLVVLLALVLTVAVAAWLLLGRRDAPPSPVARQAQEQLADLDRWSAVAEVEVSLGSVRADLNAERGEDGPSRRVDLLAASLERAFAPPEAVEGVAWPEMDAALGRLQDQVRTDDPDANDTVALIADALRTVGP